ncbi:IS66 family insertion sequence element accessory protein TnpB, partial [Pseudoalteromonas sp. AOP7-A1-14]|uniref:IS66 family insertion sequence element accessory protein TnpB n=1 Tax=Pseudoalteromonas sp. AOP7-A1-14 TaxID=3457648 RepID=UPI00402B582D
MHTQCLTSSRFVQVKQTTEVCPQTRQNTLQFDTLTGQLTFPIDLATADAVDFRKSINGLAALVEAELELPVLSGALFVFCNKGRDKLKLLYWDSTGFALWY